MWAYYIPRLPKFVLIKSLAQKITHLDCTSNSYQETYTSWLHIKFLPSDSHNLIAHQILTQKIAHPDHTSNYYTENRAYWSNIKILHKKSHILIAYKMFAQKIAHLDSISNFCTENRTSCGAMILPCTVLHMIKIFHSTPKTSIDFFQSYCIHTIHTPVCSKFYCKICCKFLNGHPNPINFC